MNRDSTILHATCVALAGNGVVIIGPSGAGKSSLALELIALGAELVADDRTVLTLEGSGIIASGVSTIAGLIEARGVGILSLPHVDRVRIKVVVDLSQQEADRLPLGHTHTVLDIALPCLHKVDAPYFPAAICAYLRGTMHEV